MERHISKVSPGGRPRGVATLWALLRSRPLASIAAATAIVSLVFILAPGLDIAAARLFYVAGAGFPAASVPMLQSLRAANDILLVLVVAAVLGALLVKVARPAAPALIAPNVSLFLLGSLALGPGLVVNGLFKSFWGRPRPNATDLFGGGMPFVPAWSLDGLCLRNCSFVSGEASSAIWLFAVVLVLPRRWRLPAGLVAAALTLALSVNRLAFGGHYLSDVVIAWGMTLFIIVALHRALVLSPAAIGWGAALDARFGRAIGRRRHISGKDAA